MAEYAGWFVEIAIAEASCDEVLDENRYSRIDADETAVVTPVYRIQVAVHLQQSRCGIGRAPYFHG